MRILLASTPGAGHCPNSMVSSQYRQLLLFCEGGALRRLRSRGDETRTRFWSRSAESHETARDVQLPDYVERKSYRCKDRR